MGSSLAPVSARCDYPSTCQNGRGRRPRSGTYSPALRARRCSRESRSMSSSCSGETGPRLRIASLIRENQLRPEVRVGRRAVLTCGWPLMRGPPSLDCWVGVVKRLRAYASAPATARQLDVGAARAARFDRWVGARSSTAQCRPAEISVAGLSILRARKNRRTGEPRKRRVCQRPAWRGDGLRCSYVSEPERRSRHLRSRFFELHMRTFLS